MRGALAGCLALPRLRAKDTRCMVVNCREALNAGAHRVLRGLRHHRPRGIHARGAAPRAASGPAAPPACSDTDAPFLAARQPKPPAKGAPGTLAKTAGVAAATAAAGTGAGLGYRSFAGTPFLGAPGIGSHGVSPDLAQALAPQPASSIVPSFVTPPGMSDTPLLPMSGDTPPVTTPGPATAVLEPASALILGAALLACVLIGGRGRDRAGGLATGRSP